MNQSKSFIFRPLCENDLFLLYNWFQEPIINQWYARGKPWSFEDIKKKYLPRILGKDNVPSFIICIENNPIGFIQYYSFKDHFPEGIMQHSHPLFHQYSSHELAGIDLFIALSDKRGKGLGQQIINEFLRELPRSIRAVLVDPVINNQQAIRCYEKAGFNRTNFSEDKTHLLLFQAL